MDKHCKDLETKIIEHNYNDNCLSAKVKPDNITSEHFSTNKQINILHRLDKDTSGLLLHSECEDCFLNVQRLIKERKTIKTYFAIVFGNIEDVTVTHFIERNKKSGKMMIKNKSSEKSKKATLTVLKYRTVHIEDILCTEIFLQLITGRTHQIRAQLSFLSRPVLGDVLYGNWKNANYSRVSNKRLQLYSMFYGVEISNESKQCFGSGINLMSKVKYGENDGN